MTRLLICLMGVCLSGTLLAQPPLSKRDQQRKAEFEAMIQAEKDYEETLTKAERAFEEKNYVEARMAYEEAIQYNPEEEQWLISKVNDLDILMARNVARRIDSVLVDVPRLEQTALPTPPTPKIIEIDEPEIEEEIEIEVLPDPEPEPLPLEANPMVDEQEEVEVVEDVPAPSQTVTARNIQLQPKTAPVKPSPTVDEVKVKEDFNAFDNGITEETFDLPNHSVLRVVVKEGIDVKVFKRVKHRWGGEFYFLDDQDISRRYWEEQVRMYREKYPED